MAVDLPPIGLKRAGELCHKMTERVVVSQGFLLKTCERERRRVLRAMNVKPFLGDERAARHPFLRSERIDTHNPHPANNRVTAGVSLLWRGVHKQLINVRFDNALVHSCSPFETHHLFVLTGPFDFRRDIRLI